MLRAMLRATYKHQWASSLLRHVATMLRLYCDHVATWAACNIQHQEFSSPPPRQKSQHHMSATSKPNIRNIEIQCLQHPTTRACNIETQHLKH
jgi:hypothetical protein